MNKAGGILGIIAGTFGLLAAIATLFLGGIGSAFEAEKADTVISLGWGGVLFSLLVIIFGSLSFGKPKSAGQGLIACSIGGAIFGGTLVAGCMIISFVAGIFCLIGSKNKTPSKEEPQDTKDNQEKKQKSPWGWAAISFVALIIFMINLGNKDTQEENKKDPISILAESSPSQIQPHGELAELFAFGSKGTDLQRENKFKEIKGQIIEWNLPVYDVERHKDGYKIQTSSETKFGHYGRNVLGTFAYITPLNDVDRKKIESLKTGDYIKFKGKIDSVSMRSFRIKPAVLSSD